MNHSMRVLFVSAEVAPYAKVGGLADVAGSLPKALHQLGHEVRIVMPAYPLVLNSSHWTVRFVRKFSLAIRPDWREEISLYTIDSAPVPTYLLQVGAWFENASESQKIYAVDPKAYVAFSRAVVQLIAEMESEWVPQVVHCNDWHTALIPVMLRVVHHPLYDSIATVCTIHNLAYQGIFDRDFFYETGLPESLLDEAGLELFHKVNLMKGGLLFSDYVNTVSPTYAQEIQTPEYGEQLEGVLRRLHAEGRLVGILNGIDNDEWNPETDPYIPANYTAHDLSGKTVCKAHLQTECGWQVDHSKAVIGLVARLTDQKGLDLIKAIGARILQLPVQLVVLGTGAPAYERYFRALHKRHRAKVHVTLGFDNALAHRIYAGSDMFLMPSRFEPCGLGQMISLRYGTIPIVRQTGGLADSITPYDSVDGTGNGFVFRGYQPTALYEAVESAVQAFKRTDSWRALVSRVMQEDWSWARSAQAYAQLYLLAWDARAQATSPLAEPATR